MTKEQLIEAMSLLGYSEDTDYTIDSDYDQIEMVQPKSEDDTTLEKPSLEQLQSSYEAEQERLRKVEVQFRLDALDAVQDWPLLIETYIKSTGLSKDPNDSLNIALMKKVDSFESGSGWRFKNIPKPTLPQLEALQLDVEDLKNQQDINVENLKFLQDTDWKVLRHLREQLLGVKTSMTQQEFKALEQERQDKAKSIKL